jgi:hypothetical protein
MTMRRLLSSAAGGAWYAKLYLPLQTITSAYRLMTSPLPNAWVSEHLTTEFSNTIKASDYSESTAYRILIPPFDASYFSMY